MSMFEMQDTLGFHKSGQDAARKEDLRRLKSFDQFIAKILEQVHYITKLKEEQKVAPVENIKERIEKAARKLNKYMDQPENAVEERNVASPGAGPGGDNIPIEKHPLLPDMGGMPMELDNLDAEFLDELLGTTAPLDKSELQNQIKNKLEAKLKMLNKMQAEIKHKVKNQPSYKPVQKQVNELVHKYKLTLDNLKNKPMLQPDLEPKYQPRITIPPPRPPGAGG